MRLRRGWFFLVIWGGIAFAALTVLFQTKLQARTSNCKSGKGLRVLCEVLPLNCENEATVGSDKSASPHSVNFILGQRKALEGLTLCNFVVYLRF